MKQSASQVVILILIIVRMTSGEALSSEPIQSLIAEGVQLMDKNKWQEAVDYFEDLSKSYPEESDIYFRLGISYTGTNALKNAVDVFRKSIRLNPKNIEAYLRLAGLIEGFNRLPEAQRLYKKVIALDPSGKRVGVSRFKIQMLGGIIEAQNSNFKKALHFFTEAEKFAPSHPPIHYNKGLVYLNLGDEQSAEEAFKKVIALDPNYQDAYIKLGVIFEKQGKVDVALRLFVKAFELNPEAVGAQIAKGKIPLLQGRLLARRGRLDEALELFLGALSFSQEQATLFYNIGLIFLNKKMSKETERAFLKVVSIDPNHQDAYLNLGNLYESQGRFQDALNVFVRAVQIDPRTMGGFTANKKIPLLQGSALAKSGRFEEALAVFQQALTFSREQAAIYFNMARIYLQINNIEAAEQSFLETVEHSPKHQRAYIFLGGIYDQQGKYEEALVAYEAAFKTDKTSTQGKNALVSSFTIKGKQAMGAEQYEDALKWFEKAAEFQPENPVNFFNLGAYFQKLNNLESAALAFEKVVTLDPEDRNTAMLLIAIRVHQIIALGRKGERQDAENALSRLLQIAPQEEKAFFQVLSQNIEAGDGGAIQKEVSAIEDYEWLIPLIGRERQSFFKARLHLLRGVVLGRENDYESARTEFEALIQEDPREVMGYFNLGFGALRRKNAEAALVYFTITVLLAPRDQPKRFRLASLHEEMGRLQKAAALYEIILADKTVKGVFRTEVEERLKHLFTSVTLGYDVTIDDNINLSKRPADDVISAVFGQYQHFRDFGQGRVGGLRFTPRLSSFLEEQISFISARTQFLYEWRGYQKKKTLEYQYAMNFFEGGLSSQVHQLGFNGYSSVGENKNFLGDVRFIFSDNASNNSLDAYQPSVSGTLFFNQWAGGQLSFRTRLSANLNAESSGDKLAYYAASPFIGYNRSLFPGIRMNSSYDYTYRDYIHQEQGFLKKRITHSHSLRLGVTFFYERGVQFFINGTWIVNESNLPPAPTLVVAPVNIGNSQTEEALSTGGVSAPGSYKKLVGAVGLRITF